MARWRRRPGRRLRRLRQHARGPVGAVPPSAGGEPRAGGGLRPGLAADRADRPRRRPVVGARLPAPVRAVARARRAVRAAARRPGRVDGIRPAAARRRPAAARRPGGAPAPRPTAAADAAERERMADVVADLIASDDSEMHVMSMLRGQDLRTALVDEDAVPGADADLLAGPFAHVVVDEAQELTDAEWQMVLGRCPSRSLTIVGDRAQARHGFTESWQERLERAGLRPGRGGVAEHQLPHPAGGHGRGRAGHPGRDPRRQRADLDPAHRRAGRARRRHRARRPSSTGGWPRTPRGSRASSATRPSRPPTGSAH